MSSRSFRPVLLCSLLLAGAQAAKPVDTAQVYTYVEQMPQPPGGMEGLMQYLGRNIKPSAQALRDVGGGKILVQFVVRHDGMLTGLKVLRGISPALDAEVVRVLRQMPPWTPGRQNGQTVQVSYTVPVHIDSK